MSTFSEISSGILKKESDGAKSPREPMLADMLSMNNYNKNLKE